MYDRLLGITEAARQLGISPSTMRRLEESGKLSSHGLQVIYTPGGQRRYLFNQTAHLYDREGFSDALGFGSRPVLLIRDMTMGFCEPGSPWAMEMEAQVESIQALIQVMKEKGFPVIFTYTQYDPNHSFSRLWQKKFHLIERLIPGSKWVEPHPELSKYTYDLMYGTYYISDFHGGVLSSWLDARGIDTVILAGATTAGSIRANAVDAFQTERRVIVPREAVGDRTRLLHSVTLIDLNGRYADVLSLAQTLTSIAQCTANVPVTTTVL